MFRKGLTVTTILIAAIVIVAVSLLGFYVFLTINDTPISLDGNLTNNTIGNQNGTPVNPIDTNPQTHLACISNRCVVVQGAGSNLNGCTTINSACTTGTGGGGGGGGGGSGGGSGGGTGGTSNVAPTAQFEAIPSNGTAPLYVFFNGSGSSDSDGTIISYAWNFGDNTSSTGMLVNHTYTIVGIYNVTLVVTDDDSATGSATSSINVGNPADTTPPQYSNVIANPANAVYTPIRVYTFSSTWTDNQGMNRVDFIFDGITYPATANGSTYTYVLNNLGAGTHTYSFRGFDLSSNTNQTTTTNYIVAKNTTNLNLVLTPSNTVQQTTQTTATGSNCPSQVVCVLTRNGASVSNPDVQTLVAGTYAYNYSSSGNANYSATSTTANLTVTSQPTFTLSVTKQATNGGTGTVTSSDGGINCGATCNANYIQNTLVTLNATASAGSSFSGWSGACTGTGACQVTMSQAQNVIATFALNAPTAPSNLQATAISQTRIDLTWTDNSNNEANFTLERATSSTFTTIQQTFTIAANTQSFSDTTLTAGTTYFYRVRANNAAGSSSNSNTANATTVQQQFLLSVSKTGTGSGTITSNPAGINCGAVCSANYVSGTQVTLTANSSAGSTFAGWSGACTGTGSCSVTMSQAQSVTATFTLNPVNFTLAVSKIGTGVGTVTSNVSGINCGATCSANYVSGTNVLLTATPTAGSTFTGWLGACSGIGTCTVSMTANRSVTANFTTLPPAQFNLTVTKTGLGSGTITSNPIGINCGSTCSASYNSGTQVTLTPTPTAGSIFSGWSGACTGSGACQVTMNSNQAVSAAFNTQTGSAPVISFIAPTPANGATQTSTAATISVSSSDATQHYTLLDFNQDLLLWLRMDDVDGSGNPTDLSSYSNVFARNGNAAQALTGMFGRSFSFDGTGDYLMSANAPGFANAGGGSFTISAWVNPTNVADGYQAVTEYGRSGSSWFGIWKSGNGPVFHFRIGDQRFDGTTTLANNQWYHVVGTYDDTTNVMTLYVNGNVDTTQTLVPVWSPAASALAIGGRSDAGGETFFGNIDDVAMFSRALSANEVRSLFNAGTTQYSRAFTNLPFAAYTYQAHAVDIAGARGDTETRTLTIQAGPDSTPPAVTLSTPTNGATVAASPLAFTGTATDNQALKNVTLWLWQGNTIISRTTQTISGTSAGVNFASINLPAAGAYKWNLQVFDLAGNSAFGGSNFTLTYAPPVCGNGVIESGEACDGSQLGGATCSSLGYTGGTLSCSASCTYNTNLCTGQPSGWTQFTPSADSRIVYVSQTDSNNCRTYTPAEVGADPEHPSIAVGTCRTLQEAYNLLQDGRPDWVLLKRGDTWNTGGSWINWMKGGRSATEKMRIASYGSSILRPTFTLPNSASQTGLQVSAPSTHLAITDLHITYPFETAAGADIIGLRIASCVDCLIENTFIEGFGNNINLLTSPVNARNTNITIRRNIIAYAINPGANPGERSMGIYGDAANYAGTLLGDLVIEQNLFYHNGYTSRTLETGDNFFNHAMYLSEGNLGPAIIRQNLFLLNADCSKTNFNPTLWYNNTCIKTAVGPGTAMSHDNNVIQGNVIMDPTTYDPQWETVGILFNPGVNNWLVSDNIIAHNYFSGYPGGATPPILGINTNTGNNHQYLRNIIYNWCAAGGFSAAAVGFFGTETATFQSNQFQQHCAQSIYDTPGTGAGYSYSNNKYYSDDTTPFGGSDWNTWRSQAGESGSTFGAVNYVDPNRDLGTYLTSLGLGNYAFNTRAGFDAFVNRAINQSKFSWDDRLTAQSFNDYVKQGFTPGTDNPSSNGWTQLTPSGDSRIMYVSASATGSSCTAYSLAQVGADPYNPTGITPCTFSAAMGLLRNGFPDYILLKRGDTWNMGTINWNINGRSKSEKAVIGAYGSSGARPKIIVPTSPGIGFEAFGRSNYAVTNLDITTAPHTTSSGTGMGMYGSFHDVLIEGNRIEGFAFGIYPQPHQQGGLIANLSIRRNILVNILDATDNARSTGIYGGGEWDDSANTLVSQMNDSEFVENIFVTNGLPSPTATEGSLYNHAFYMSWHNTMNYNLRFAGNVVLHSASGAKFGSVNGIYENNTFIKNAVALEACCDFNTTVRNNVVTDAVRFYNNFESEGYLIDQGSSQTTIIGNIVAHQRYGNDAVHGFGIGATTNTRFINNTIYDWCAPARSDGASLAFSSPTSTNFLAEGNYLQQNCNGQIFKGDEALPAGSGYTWRNNHYYSPQSNAFKGISYTQWVQQSGETGSTFGEVNFVDTNRDAATYMTSLGRGNYNYGDPAGYAAFEAAQLAQNRWNWDPTLSAHAYNKYIQDGFVVQGGGFLMQPPQTGSGSGGDAPVLNSPDEDISPLSSLTSFLRRIFGFNVATSPASIVADDQNAGIIGHAIASSNVRISDQKLLLSVIGLLVIAIALVLVVFNRNQRK